MALNLSQAFANVVSLPVNAVRGVGRAVFGPGHQPLRELGAGMRNAFAQLPGSAQPRSRTRRIEPREMLTAPMGQQQSSSRDLKVTAQDLGITSPPAPKAQVQPRTISSTATELEAHLGDGLRPHAQDFVDAGKEYGMDPRFLAAVSKLETGNGTSSAFRNKRNAMGISDNRGPLAMETVRDSIFRQARTLARQDGPYAKADSIAQIGAIYAPPGAGNDVNGTNGSWPAEVSRFYAEMGGDPKQSVRGAWQAPPKPVSSMLIDPIY